MIKLLGAAATEQEEEIKWASDSEEDSEEESDEEEDSEEDEKITKAKAASAESSTTLHPATQEKEKVPATTTLKPAEPRKSHDEKSQADSDGSYDVVGAASGVPSRAPNSPKEKEKEKSAGVKKDEESEEEDDSEEEDWE